MLTLYPLRSRIPHPMLPARHLVAYLLAPERLELREVALPRPETGELLLRVEAATTCGTDLKVFLRGGHPRMLEVPGPFGHEMAGVVAAVGAAVRRFAEGDRVVVANSAPCGDCSACRRGDPNLCLDLHYLNGAYGQHLLVPSRFVERATYRLPDGLAYQRAAVAEPLACVLHGLDVLALAGPDEALVLGAGPIGLLFVRLLALAGHRVVVADPHPQRLAVATRLGASGTLILPHESLAEAVPSALSHDPEGFALAVDATGAPAGWEIAVHALRPGGQALFFGGCPPGTTITVDTHRLHYSQIGLRGAYHHTPASFARAVERLATDGLDVEALLSAERPLRELAEALQSMRARRALKVVIRPHAG